jgi:outer membrane lipoprotein SlyB
LELVTKLFEQLRIKVIESSAHQSVVDRSTHKITASSASGAGTGATASGATGGVVAKKAGGGKTAATTTSTAATAAATAGGAAADVSDCSDAESNTDLTAAYDDDHDNYTQVIQLSKTKFESILKPLKDVILGKYVCVCSCM